MPMIVNNSRILPGLSRRQARRLILRFLAGETIASLAAVYRVRYVTVEDAIRCAQYPQVRAALKLG